MPDLGGIKVEFKAEQRRDELGRYQASVESGLHAAMMELAVGGANVARTVAPKRTGRLSGSIMVFGGGLSAGFRTNVPYASYQEHGTGPKGRRGQFLTNHEDFYGIGPVAGTPATHYMQAGRAFIHANIERVVGAYLP